MDESILEEAPAIAACPRCRGRMMSVGADGDLSCFTCGHVSYLEVMPKIEPGDKRERRPSHGGQSL